MKYQTNDPCTACGKETYGGNCLHHVKTRGSGGTDVIHNLMPLCFIHHTEVHKIGLLSFSSKYKNVLFWLTNFNWKKCPLKGTWNHLEEI